MGKVVRFPRSRGFLDAQGAAIVERVRAMLWETKVATGRPISWMARSVHASPRTFYKLMDLKGGTRNPMWSTIWAAFRACDNASIIDHSELEHYRKFSPEARAIIKSSEQRRDRYRRLAARRRVA